MFTAAVVLTWLVVRLFWSAPSSLDRYREGQLSRTVLELETAAEAEEIVVVGHCFRQLGDTAKFQAQLTKAGQLPGGREAVELAQALYRVQSGNLNDTPEQVLKLLLDAGAVDTDAYSCVVEGLMATKKLEQAAEILDLWRSRQPGLAQPEYLSGVLLNYQGKHADAEAKFLNTVVRFPGHELSWLALVDAYSRPPNVRFEQVESILSRFVQAFPENADAPARLNRIRRRLGKATPDGLIGSGDVFLAAYESAKSAFDIGAYEDALSILQSANFASVQSLNQATDVAFQLSMQGKSDPASELGKRISMAATTLALSGKEGASQIFEISNDRTARLRRIQDLANRRVALPRTSTGELQAITDETNAMTGPAFTPAYPTIENAAMRSESPSGGTDWENGLLEGYRKMPGYSLYLQRCANCHGDYGDGDGIAASNLFPRPRSFINEPIRMVTTENKVASVEDLRRAIRQGQPGSSMPAFTSLTDLEVDQIVQVLQAWIRKAAYSRWMQSQSLVAAQEESEVQRAIEAATQPSPKLSIPSINIDASLIGSGKDRFLKAGCVQCHGDPENPSPESRVGQRFFDSLGRPILAPNLKSDRFRGGDRIEDIYARVQLGIAGTPHPSLASGDAMDAYSIAAYIHSIRNAPSIRQILPAGSEQPNEPSAGSKMRVQDSDRWWLLTGATGLLGQFVLDRLMEMGQNVAVLVRASSRQSPGERIRRIVSRMRHSERMPRVVGIDLGHPQLGLAEEDRQWLLNRRLYVIHAAASIRFQFDALSGEPYRSNVDGLRNLLQMLQMADVESFHLISTAYVSNCLAVANDEANYICRETPIESHQRGRNDYESSKIAAEDMVLQCDWIGTRTILRPSIIVGDSATGYTSTYHGFYAPLKVCHHLVQNFGFRYDGQNQFLSQLGLKPCDAKNFVPVDWVAEAVVRIAGIQGFHNAIYNLTNPRPTACTEIESAMQRALAKCSGGRMAAKELDPLLMQGFREQLSVYESYFNNDPIFSCEHTQAVLPDLPCPTVDEALLERLADYAVAQNFGWPST